MDISILSYQEHSIHPLISILHSFYPLSFIAPSISFFLISHSIQIIPSLFTHSMSSISVEVFVE